MESKEHQSFSSLPWLQTDGCLPAALESSCAEGGEALMEDAGGSAGAAADAPGEGWMELSDSLPCCERGHQSFRCSWSQEERLWSVCRWNINAALEASERSLWIKYCEVLKITKVFTAGRILFCYSELFFSAVFFSAASPTPAAILCWTPPSQRLYPHLHSRCCCLEWELTCWFSGGEQDWRSKGGGVSSGWADSAPSQDGGAAWVLHRVAGFSRSCGCSLSSQFSSDRTRQTAALLLRGSTKLQPGLSESLKVWKCHENRGEANAAPPLKSRLVSLETVPPPPFPCFWMLAAETSQLTEVKAFTSIIHGSQAKFWAGAYLLLLLQTPGEDRNFAVRHLEMAACRRLEAPPLERWGCESRGVVLLVLFPFLVVTVPA